jgi:hypothetical protein
MVKAKECIARTVDRYQFLVENIVSFFRTEEYLSITALLYPKWRQHIPPKRL